MDAEVKISYSIEDALRELGQDGNIPQEDEIIVSRLQDIFFKGGGCETSSPATGDAIPHNIAVCMNGHSDPIGN